MKKPSKPRKPKMLGHFRDIPNEKRRNPQAIRRMMFDLVALHYGANCKSAADALEAVRKKHKGRTYGARITQDGLYKAISDTHWIKYFLLEAIAIERGVPVSLLLFYTRLCADQSENGGEVKVRQLIEGMTFALADAEGKIERNKKIGFEDLAQWVDKFAQLMPPPAREPVLSMSTEEPSTSSENPDQLLLPGIGFPIRLKLPPEDEFEA